MNVTRIWRFRISWLTRTAAVIGSRLSDLYKEHTRWVCARSYEEACKHIPKDGLLWQVIREGNEAT